MEEVRGWFIKRLLPESTHSVTAEGFELKVGLFVRACSLHLLWLQPGLKTGGEKLA
jgi:hypothetical protein